MGKGNSPRAAARLVAALFAAAAVSIALSVPADSAPLSRTLAPGQVTTATPPDAMSVPADGRLRGADFSATVTGVAWPASVLASGLTTVAGAGQRLVVFSLRITQPASDVGPLADGKAATASIGVEGRELPVDLTALDQQIEGQSGDATGTGAGTFSVSVPAHDHDVVLTMAETGFSQRFNLWTLKRLSPSPVILYRNPSSATVTTSASATALLPTVNPADGYSNPAKLTLSGATLTEFAPDGSGTTPAHPTEAFLVPDVSATENGPAFGSATWGHYFSTLTTLTGTQFTFTPTGGTPVPASTAPLSTTVGYSGDGLFHAQFWFTVPATTTSGTLRVASGSTLGVEYLGFSAGPGKVSLQFPTPADLAVPFPPVPAAPPAQRTPPWVGAPLPATGAAATGSSTVGGDAGGGGFPIWAAVVIVAVLAALAIGAERLVRRRRRLAVATVEGALSPADTTPTKPTWARASETDEPAAPPRAPPEAEAIPVVLGGSGDLVVRVLGPIEVSGWQVPPERRGVAEELSCYLALHPDRAFTTAELLAALWPVGGDRGEASPKTLRNHLSRLRQAAGPDHLPDAVTSGGYRILGCVTDWGEFTRLTSQAAATAGGEADDLRRQALTLVRGVPFADARGGQYEWAFSTTLASSMVVAIADCANRLLADRLAAGDARGAEEAARAGLRAAPDDETLWLALVRATAAAGEPSALGRVWRDAASALGSERVEVLRRHMDL